MSELLLELKCMVCLVAHRCILKLFAVDDENIRIRLFLYDNRINM